MGMRIFKQAASFGAIVILAGCGGSSSSSSSSGASNLSGLGDIPSASGMIASSTSSSVVARENLAYALVSGAVVDPEDAPLVTSISSSNVDTYFWRGMISEIGEGVEADHCSGFWGGDTDGDPGGMPACFMSQNTMYTFENVVRASGSTCYMKNLPEAESGVTLTPDLSDRTTLFDQQAADRVIRVDTSGEEEEADGVVFIRVEGSDDVGSDTYQVRLWFCDEVGGTQDGAESISVTKSTGAITISNTYSDEWGSGEVSLSGFINETDSGFGWDSTKDRVATITNSNGDESFSFDWKSQLTITADNIIKAKEYEYENANNYRKSYVLSQVSGSSLTTLRFLAAAVNVQERHNGQSNNFSAGVEWRGTGPGYVIAPEGDLVSDLSDVDLTSDSFYDSAPVVDVTLEDSCSVTPDYVVGMDFSDSAVADIQELCDGDRLENQDYCWSSTVRAAEESLYSSSTCGFGGE